MQAPQSPIENLALVREANHRFANHLAVILSSVNRQLSVLKQSSAETVPRAEVRAMLEELAGSVYSIANLNRLLAQAPLTDTVDLEELLRLTTQNITGSLGHKGHMDLNCAFGGTLQVPYDVARAILLITIEVTMNTLKHAHPPGNRVRLDLSCQRKECGALLLWIGDNGNGLPAGFDVERDGGTGFKVIRMLARSLGRLEITSNSSGLSFRLEVPPAHLLPKEAGA